MQKPTRRAVSALKLLLLLLLAYRCPLLVSDPRECLGRQVCGVVGLGRQLLVSGAPSNSKPFASPAAALLPPPLTHRPYTPTLCTCQDVDAVLAAEAALEEWRKQGDEMHVSPRMLSPALQAQDAATLPGPHLGDMQDTPLRVESSHGMAGGSRGSGGAGVERGAARASRLPPPMAHRGTGSRRGGVI
jgi:hypothetical protein